MALIASGQMPEIAEPGPEPFNLPAAPEPPQRSPVLGRWPHSILFVRCNHLDAMLPLHLDVQRIAVVGKISDQTFGLFLHEATFYGFVDQRHFVRRSRLNANGDRKTMRVSDRHDLCTQPPLCFPNKRAPFLAGTKLPST